MQKLFYIALVITLLSSCLNTPESEYTFLTEISYEELHLRVQDLNMEKRADNWLYIIDFGDKEVYNEGHISYAVNVELKNLMDEKGYLVNQGKAITQRFEDDWPFVVYSSSNDTVAYWVAKTFEALGFSRVYFYEGGLEEWQGEHANYLDMNLDGFREWYEENQPFEDTLQALVDIHPEAWFYGEQHLEGHIRWATNIPSDSLIASSGSGLQILNGGSALSSKIPEKEAQIVIYYATGEDQRASDFLAAAQELGYKRMYRFSDGYNFWMAENEDDIVRVDTLIP